MKANNKVRYACPWCTKRLYKQDLVNHIQDDHMDVLPEDCTPLRYVFNYTNKRPITYHGKCTECGSDTLWDENKGRYDRQCEKPSCRASYLKRFEENMMRVRGVKRISSTPEGQELMLANRRISGKYKFQDGGVVTYTGTYEGKALKFMDQVMNISSKDIMCPGPVITYQFEGKDHFYISDIYYIPYNLVIEVKDGGSNPNTRPMESYRAKQLAKEDFINKHTEYNYLRLTDNDFGQLLEVFMLIKMQLIENTNERVFKVNEMMNALTSGFIPGFNKNSVFLGIRRRKPNFSHDEEEDMILTDDIDCSSIICRNNTGILKLEESNSYRKDNYFHELYEVKLTDEIKEKIKENFGQYVEEGFLYNLFFNKPMYSLDQIRCEDEAVKVEMDQFAVNERLRLVFDIKDELKNLQESIENLSKEN